MHTPTSKYNSRAKLSLLIIGVLVLFAAPQFLNLKFDYDFEKFFPKGDQELEFYLQHRDRFETHNDFFLILDIWLS